MMEPGADLEWLEGEFHTINKAENVDKAMEHELESESLELVHLVQGLSEGDDIKIEDETVGAQGKETEGESEQDEDDAEDGESVTSKCMQHQLVYVAVLLMKVVGKGAMGDWGPVSTSF